MNAHPPSKIATFDQRTFYKISAHGDAFYRSLKALKDTLGIGLDDRQIAQLMGYLDALLVWTKAYNLTAITDPKDAFAKHILDCLAVVPSLPMTDRQAVRVLDIGTGAGLPAVIFAIVRPDWHIHALDSNGKKIRFIRQMRSELGLDNLTPIASRIEAFAGEFDIITSRAFASLSDFVVLSQAYLADNGVLYAMKGKAPSQADLAAFADWSISVQPITVPDLDEERCVVLLKR